MRGAGSGFTLMEVLIAVAIVGVLAMLAVPSFQSSIVRDQIVQAVPLTNIAKKPIEIMWAAAQALPANNAAAGLPPAGKIVNNVISAVTVQDGAIHITFGNNVNGAIKGKILTLRPAVVEDTPVVPVAWVCGFASPPGGMTVKGEDRTDIPEGLLPFNCKPTPGG
jgi:type IV pilus assembly protein PilA